MKLLVVTFCLVLSVLAEDKYQSVNDNFDLAEVLENERLLNSYAKCLLNKGPCIPEVKQLKEKLPEALATRCAKCTDRQKQGGKKVAQEIKKNHPDLWNQLVAMYDPDSKYQQAWEDFLKE